MKYITLVFLTLFSFKTNAGQSFISASFLSSEDDSSQSSLTIGTEVFKNGQFSLFGVRNRFQGDDEEITTNGLGLSYSHNLSKYFTLGIGGNRLVEGEYLASDSRNAFIQFNLNYLWNSLAISSLEIETQETRYDYERMFNTREVDRTLGQRSVSIRYTQEITLWLDLTLSTTKFQYSEDIIDIIDTRATQLNFLPELQGLLYGVPESTRSLGLDFYIDEYTLSFNFLRSVNLVTQDDESLNQFSFSIPISSWEITLGLNRVKLEQTENNQYVLGLGYFF